MRKRNLLFVVYLLCICAIVIEENYEIQTDRKTVICSENIADQAEDEIVLYVTLLVFERRWDVLGFSVDHNNFSERKYSTLSHKICDCTTIFWKVTSPQMNSVTRPVRGIIQRSRS